MRICSRCDIEKDIAMFPKDFRKLLGIAYACKECKAKERHVKKDAELARWKRYYAPGSDNRQRHVVRGLTRAKHGPAKLHKCHDCGQQAIEWHHTAYTVDDVIPLCHSCHTKQE